MLQPASPAPITIRRIQKANPMNLNSHPNFTPHCQIVRCEIRMPLPILENRHTPYPVSQCRTIQMKMIIRKNRLKPPFYTLLAILALEPAILVVDNSPNQSILQGLQLNTRQVRARHIQDKLARRLGIFQNRQRRKQQTDKGDAKLSAKVRKRRHRFLLIFSPMFSCPRRSNIDISDLHFLNR